MRSVQCAQRVLWHEEYRSSARCTAFTLHRNSSAIVGRNSSSSSEQRTITSSSSSSSSSSSLSSSLALGSKLKTGLKRLKRTIKATAASDDDENKSTQTMMGRKEEEDVPPWARRDIERKEQKGEFAWPIFLLLSLITLLAATGSVFEWTFEKPIFGVVQSTSALYKPILGWFIVTGFPLSAFFWMKGIDGANKASALTDKMDGYD